MPSRLFLEASLRSSEPHDEVGGSALWRFEVLFREHAGAVLAYAIRRSDRDTAQEVFAETFAVAWRRIEVIPDPPLPWLLGVARKVLANDRRSRSRAEALAIRLVREPVGSSDDPADAVDARLSAQAALGRLFPAEREVLELLAWDGLTAAQAAEVLGCSRATITMRMHRARRRLSRLLDEPTETRSSRMTGVASVKEADDAR